jgi:TatD DNase family protein
MILVDSHCHLERLEEVSATVERAKAAGVIHAVVIGQFRQPGDFGHALEVARSAPDFFSPTMGIHPHDAAKATEKDFEMLSELCARPEVVAVGEAGLDFYYQHSPRDTQASLLRRQCTLALSIGKPLVVHVRDAHVTCHEILRSQGVRRGVIHCFTGGVDDARRYLDLGFYLSISGIVTYKKTDALQEAVRFAPLDRLLVETDSPYLAPVPHRGRQNEPAYVGEVARKLAELRGLSPEEAALATARNSGALFGFQVSHPEASRDDDRFGSSRLPAGQ